MKLREFMEKNELDAYEMSILLDCSEGYIYQMLRGRVRPGPHFLKKLVELTCGDVKGEDFNDVMPIRRTKPEKKKIKNKPKRMSIKLHLYEKLKRGRPKQSKISYIHIDPKRYNQYIQEQNKIESML